MNKYTINKAFEKHFPFPIWKIEVDCSNNCLAIEYRNPTDTLPSFAVVTFEGDTLLENYTALEKEWTIASIQDDYLIFKRFGASSPIQAGIQVLHIPSQSIIFCYQEYVIKGVYEGIIKAAHRSIPSGIDYYIDLKTGIVDSGARSSLHLPHNNITYPISYQGYVPDFIESFSFEDQIWLQPYKEIFIWSYHKKNNNSFDLYLSLSTKNEILDNKIILTGLDRLIPQPYFQVKGHIFFLSNTKQEIATYLV
ncbi:hypothetical protein [Sphingobacterium faecale]|uniref:DUF4905 domain-containing protein n=1 Tax=Sphingobacterium faecale TaxID=2803775 RepID=A0ABS1QYN3_9SPHI|nr:hypothetical protein [Sphingobacterium faecale]MBL1407295.1 hypothetical protein [Sphingobacterium faecale]